MRVFLRIIPFPETVLSPEWRYIAFHGNARTGECNAALGAGDDTGGLSDQFFEIIIRHTLQLPFF
jgi:hypothetical protein